MCGACMEISKMLDTSILCAGGGAAGSVSEDSLAVMLVIMRC